MWQTRKAATLVYHCILLDRNESILGFLYYLADNLLAVDIGRGSAIHGALVFSQDSTATSPSVRTFCCLSYCQVKVLLGIFFIFNDPLNGQDILVGILT